MLLKWTPNGGSTLILDRPYYFLQGGPDFGFQASLQRQRSPYQHGTTLVDKRFTEREVTLDFLVVTEGTPTLHTLRREIMQAFNPDKGLGVLQWDQAGTIYAVDCIVEEVAMPAQRRVSGQMHQRVMVFMVAPEPFLYDPEETEEAFQTFTGGLLFDEGGVLWPDDGIQFGEVAGQKTATNNGDVDAPVEINFYGPADSPAAINETTGKRIRVLQAIETGDRIRVRTGRRFKDVTHIDSTGVKTNVMHWLSPGSELWSLAVGENVITYDEASGVADIGNMTLSFRNWYVGV